MFKRGKEIFPANPRVAERIDSIVKVITDNYDTEKILLFGGFARGEFDEEYSEMDILIVANTEQRFLERIRNVREICTGYPHVDPIMYTPGEYRALLKEGEGFLEEATEEGIVIYQK
jgi:predicted nucleotidyltransferase